ncbi:Sugar transporter esl1, partial [Datura stramonium]|nr:Sugar transporter esl1 [Datura stramonium]
MERERIEDGFTTTDPLICTPGDTPAPATPAVVFSTFVAVCGSFVFGSAVGFSSPAQIGIIQDLGLSVAEYSVFGSIWTIGAMIGAVMSGKLADLFARRG